MEDSPKSVSKSKNINWELVDDFKQGLEELKQGKEIPVGSDKVINDYLDGKYESEPDAKDFLRSEIESLN